MTIQQHKKTIALFTTAVLFGQSSAVLARTEQLHSPDGKIVISVSDDDGLRYQVQYQQQPLITPSALGLALAQTPALGPTAKIIAVKRTRHDDKWSLPWGERLWVQDQYQQLQLTLSQPSPAGEQRFAVNLKAFNDGVGFRYEVAPQPMRADAKPSTAFFPALTVTNELTEFRFEQAEQWTAFTIPARGWNRYEYLYQQTPLTQVVSAHTPATFKHSSGVHLSIHEAALVDYAAMSLNQRRSGVFKADLAPWSDGSLVKAGASLVSPWRTLQISPDAKGLINSDLILNLNEPNQLGDVSWVQPSKYVGIWWGMHLGINTWGSGSQHGATTDNTKKYIDFAAENGFAGVLVEGWNVGWDGDWFFNGDQFDFTKSMADFDLAEVTRYGQSKGVKLIGHHETAGSVSHYRSQQDAAFALYQQHGVSQVKTGYVADGGQIKRIDEHGIVRHEWHDGQFMVNEYLNTLKTAAKYHIAINSHEPIKDTGLRRTYPNWLSREGARGQEYNAWGTPPNSPEHTVMLPFTRMLAGPMDFTPGIFNLAYQGLDAQNRVNTTLTKQLALYVVLYSPVQMAADIIEHYQQHQDAFQFIKAVPVDWQKSIALNGEVGDYVTIARQDRHSDDWYLGSITDEQPRTLKVKLDFLHPGKRYLAQLYRDGEHAHYLTKPYDYVIEQQFVTSDSTLTLHLAASGGTAIHFKAL